MECATTISISKVGVCQVIGYQVTQDGSELQHL